MSSLMTSVTPLRYPIPYPTTQAASAQPRMTNHMKLARQSPTRLSPQALRAPAAGRRPRSEPIRCRWPIARSCRHKRGSATTRAGPSRSPTHLGSPRSRFGLDRLDGALDGAQDREQDRTCFLRVVEYATITSAGLLNTRLPSDYICTLTFPKRRPLPSSIS